jgi:dUTP pyrophosphatase
MTEFCIRVQRIGEHRLPAPERHSPDAAGYDLRANRYVKLWPGERVLVETGFAFEIPPGWVGLIRDRSGLACQGITTRAGVIDADYRGEIKVLLVNESPEVAHEIAAGDRIAQLVIVPALVADLREVDQLSDTQRGDGGFGSTGAG